MSQNSYKPKEVLAVLIEVDAMLKYTINKHCPEKDLFLTEDLDKSLEELLQRKYLKESDVAYKSSQMALFHLRRELENAITVVIDSNNLRAHHDFSIHKKKNALKLEHTEKKWRVKEMLIGLLIGSALASFYFTVI